MSAFIVSNRHIDYLLTAGLNMGSMEGHSKLHWVIGKRHRVLSEETAERVGLMLLRENHRSVQYRYTESPKADLEPAYEYTPNPPPPVTGIDPVQVLKAIGCYEYQTCEHPGWKDSEAEEFCRALRRVAIHRLPGYAEAVWEVV